MVVVLHEEVLPEKSTEIKAKPQSWGPHCQGGSKQMSQPGWLIEEGATLQELRVFREDGLFSLLLGLELSEDHLNPFCCLSEVP